VGSAAGAAASSASASNGSSADDSVNPNAAPSPNRESAFRRETDSDSIFSRISRPLLRAVYSSAPSPNDPRTVAKAPAQRPSVRDATKRPEACNLVELRGHALKNYEAAYVGKSCHAATMAILDRRDPVLDREVNKLGAAMKSVHLHHLVLVEFDSSRGNRKIARNLLRRPPPRE
jgi:hypothetical protein